LLRISKAELDRKRMKERIMLVWLCCILAMAIGTPLALDRAIRENNIKAKQSAVDSEYYAAMHKRTANVVGLYIDSPSVCITITSQHSSTAVIVRKTELK
jgi:hypothetical protein